MFENLKKLPEEQKRILRLAVTMSSAVFLIMAALMWFFKEETMDMLGMDSTSIDIIASALCVMVVIDLVFVKSIIGEDKAK